MRACVRACSTTSEQCFSFWGPNVHGEHVEEIHSGVVRGTLG